MKADFSNYQPGQRRIGHSPAAWLDIWARIGSVGLIILALIAGGFLIGLGQSMSSLALTALFPETFVLY